MSALKPVGVFWDIENCCVPKGKSALKIIERIRELFFTNCREAEFICVCDINKESDATIKDLNDGQINVVHINATAKNAADDKIRQSLRRFSDSHPPGTKVVLISSDVNFASDLSDLRHRKRYEVVLVHKSQVSDALLLCASEHYLYEELIRDLPDRPGAKELKDPVLVVTGYNKDEPLERVRTILKMHSNNCGGKVISIGPIFAVLKFETPELLERAKKRMTGEDVYGRKITVSLPEETPFYNTVKKLTVSHLSRRQESPSPQRRSPRERRNSNRSYTPDGYEGHYGQGYNNYGNNNNYHYSGYSNYHQPQPQRYSYSDVNAQSMGDFAFVPPQAEWSSKAYKTPGGPVKQPVGTPSYSKPTGQGLSPGHTYTLPNSNSEKYYHKSSPSSDPQPQHQHTDNRASIPGMPDSSTSKSYVIGDLSGAASGQSGTITVFKPTDSGKSLADIPIPSFGFRDIPPPSLPPTSSTSTAAAGSVAPGSSKTNSDLDPRANVFDPIKLVETASMDSLRAIGKSSTSVVPSLTADEDVTEDNRQPQTYRPHSAGRLYLPPGAPKGPVGHIPSSAVPVPQGPVFTGQPPQHSSYPSFKPRGQSVPSVPTYGPAPGGAPAPSGNHHQLSADDEICIMHGYPPPSASRSQSQGNSVFKKPASPHRQPAKHPNNSGYSPRRPSPASQRSRDMRHSVSSDGEERSYSPTQGNSSRQTFRPRLASNPVSSSRVSSSPTGRALSPLAHSVNRLKAKPHGSNLYRVPTPNDMGDPAADFSHPDFNPKLDPFVELVVSNLDYNIHPREWRKIIYATFHPHVKILSIQVRLQADNTSVATVRLPSEQDARFAITQFHRRKIGYKRINVQFKSDCSQSPAEALRADTVALLMEAKDNKMALSRLIDLFDKRFHKTVSVSDIYKMRDTIHIQETGGAGRWVKLQPGIRRSPTPVQALDSEVPEVIEQPVCTIHCAEGSVHYAEAINSCMLPSVRVLRKHFSPQLHSLLLSHNGYIPLMSFPACYSAEFQPLLVAKEGGIPLEHVISCVPGVEITVSKAGVKVIQFQENRDQFYDMMKGSSWQELGKISREVMELLRQQTTCSMPVSKFIPAYHHYFGRQCRVADYGYTKLQELFEAIPHAIQILGTGDRKAITLSPRAQLKRFTTDIIKVVKAQPAKQMMLDDFPQAYERVMGKPLFLPHYGVAFMEDVLMDIPTTTLIVIEESSHTLLALPRRDQTAEEVERTKQFSLEVVDLLRHNPQCRMPFNKFIPAYHHHFGRQCRVADYGFTKLTDLFEAVGHVVEIEEEGEERLIQLSGPELRKVVCEQLSSLIRPVGSIPINRLLTEFANHFGFCLKLEDFEVESPRALISKLRNNFKIEEQDGQECVSLVKEVHISRLGLQVMQLLMDESGGCLPLMELCMRYETLHGKTCDIEQLREDLVDYVQIDEAESDTGGVIRLTSQQMLGRNLRLLLLHHERISMSELAALYRQQYGVELSPALYGFQTLYQLLLSFPHILEVRGKPHHKYLVLSDTFDTPGMLPPARVDMPSPPHQASSPPQQQQATSGVPKSQDASNLGGPLFDNVTSKASPPSIGRTTSDLLLYAAQQWDNSLAKQMSNLGVSGSAPSPSKGSPVKVSGAHIAPTGVPIAWQMKAGEGQSPDKIMTNVMRGNIGLVNNSENQNGNVKGGEKCNLPFILGNGKLPGIKTDIDEKGDGETETAARSGSTFKLENEKEEDIFSSTEPPLDTSSAHSQHNSSSQSSSSASPIKRKTRIAANFGNAM
ncbi:meiosis regulator and mRNA stability factor 1 [Aplysia californica]|uniref:Meiosis regulator and mRNA stability factor 1 n=1 Tax=Aplysia californica TaxID=6500 RepID=A0ABM0K9N3_APLCA|nr:meiosis regulator and mRNA stability factor 1 [Aplysia californica]XP_005112253.1 meiosis regulator and mRNA stability factor 1 [Aplysia californica]